MAGQSWAGIETVHTHCSQWTHSHTRPADCKFLFNECWFPMSCRGRSGGEGGRGKGAFEASISCLRFGVIKNFLKAFCGTSTWKPSLSEMRDETRWDELSDMARETHKWGRGGGGVPKKETLLSLKLTCGLSAAAPTALLLLLLWQLWRLQVGNQFFFVFTSSCCCSCCT